MHEENNMGFNQDLKQCLTLDECQMMLNKEVQRLSTLSLYQNYPQKLEQRVKQIVGDVQNHMDSSEIKGLIVVPKLGTVIEETSFKDILMSKIFYKKLIYWLSPFIIALGLLLTVASIFQLSKVSGHSMDPTLQEGSYLVSNKYSKLERFDIVVARELDKNGKPYSVVKRLIGLPGDTIEYKNDVLYINGKKTDEPYLNDYLKEWNNDRLEDEYKFSANMQQLALYSPAFTTQKTDLATKEDNENPEYFKVEVPTTGYFLIGDNRIVSKDSREVGAFPRENISGKVVWIFSKKDK